MAAGCACLSRDYFVSAWSSHVDANGLPEIRSADQDCAWALLLRWASLIFWLLCVSLWFAAAELNQLQHPQWLLRRINE
jgi:hypothetical protein